MILFEKYCVKIDKFCIIYHIFYTIFSFYCSYKNNLTKVFLRHKCSNNTSAYLISKQTEKQTLKSEEFFLLKLVLLREMPC